MNPQPLIDLAVERFNTVGPESYPDDPIRRYTAARLARDVREELADALVYESFRLELEASA